MTSSQITFAILIPLVVWRLYSRYRKLVGKQHVRPIRLWASVIIFPLLFILIGIGNLNHQTAMACLIAGGLAGAALSVLGLKLTTFEYAEGGLTYTPNAYIGLGLLLIFSGRIAYRFFQFSNASALQGQTATQSLTGSPITSLIIGVLATYYALYSAGILRRRHTQP
jgi:hypothetical protein